MSASLIELSQDCSSTSGMRSKKQLWHPQVSRVVADVLSVLGEEAAAENDKLQLFTSPERFPEVLHPLRHVTAGGKLTADSKLGMKPGLERSPRRDGGEDEHQLVCWRQVFEQAEAVAAAEKALQRLLPDLRRQLRLPSLQYVHPANQGVSQAGRSQQHVLSQVSLGIARASVPDTPMHLLWMVYGNRIFLQFPDLHAHVHCRMAS